MSYEPTIWRTGDTVTAEKLNKIEQAIAADNTAIEGKVGRDEFDTEIATLESKVGSPLKAQTVSEMTDHDRVYVYTGSEDGYTAGYWYSYDATQTPPWVPGGVYNAVAIETDTTLSVSGKAADAKEVGDELSSLKEDLNIVSDGLDDEIARAKAEEARIEALFTADVSEAVNDWLDDHPEATTTVQDGSLTEEKFSNALKIKSIKDYVTPEMYGATGDGETDDSVAFASALATGKTVMCFGDYAIAYPIVIPSYANFLCYGSITYTGNAHAITIGCGHSNVFVKNLVSAATGIRIGKNFDDEYPWVAYNSVEVNKMNAQSHCLYMSESSIPSGASVSYNGVMYNAFKIGMWSSVAGDGVHVEIGLNGFAIFFNENTFFGGLISAKGNYAIYLSSVKESDLATYNIGANKFYATSFEGSVNGVYLNNASNNVFCDNRYEGNTIAINLVDQSWDNRFRMGGVNIKKIDTTNLVSATPNNLHKNIFDCTMRVGESARMTYHAYVTGANIWHIDPFMQIYNIIKDESPTLTMVEPENITTVAQLAECNTCFKCTTANGVLNLSKPYSDKSFGGISVSANSGCKLTVNDYQGNTLFTVQNMPDNYTWHHWRNYNGTWRRDA